MALPFTRPSPPGPQPAEPHPAEPRHLHAVDVDQPGPEAATAADPDTDQVDGQTPRAEQATQFLRAAFTPDSGLYTDRQPSIAEGLRRARRGGQVADKGPLRVLAIGHGYVAAANKAACNTWVWIVDHPARLIVATVLLGLAIAFPLTRHLISALLTPLVWVQQALD